MSKSKPQLVEEVIAPSEEELSDEQLKDFLPTPTGFRILCALPKIDQKFAGTDLVRPESVVDRERLTTVVLFVLALGPDAYKDTTRFPSGPLCKVGDWVLCRQYSGTRFRVYGSEYRLLSDDQIEATVENPKGISHV